MGRKKLDDKERKRKIQPVIEGWRLDQLGGDKVCELLCVDFLKRKTRKRIKILNEAERD